MAFTENGLGGHSCSSIMVPMDKNGSRETHHNVPFQRLKCMQKDDEDDTEFWARPRIPLRPPFSVPIPGACGALTLTPATEKESLATEVNSSEGLENQSKKEYDSINVSQEISGSPKALMIRGPIVGSAVIEGNGNSSKPYMPVPRSQRFFPRAPRSLGLRYVPTLISGIMMEVTPGNGRMAYNGSLAHVSFPQGSPRHPVDNWQQRSHHLLTSVSGLPSTAYCFLPPQPPAFNAIPVMPSPFASPLRFGPPLLPYFFRYSSGAMHHPPYLY